MCMIAPLRLPERDSYLTHEEHGAVALGVAINPEGRYRANVNLQRDSDSLWLTLELAAFSASLCMTAAEARLVAEAMLKAAEDAEKFQRQLQDDIEVDMAHERDMEMDLVREAEARGEEYVPTAIGVEHMNHIEMTMLHGGELKPWQAELKPEGEVWVSRTDGGSYRLDDKGKIQAVWFRWSPASHPLLHSWTVLHEPLEHYVTNNATVDDFGTLVMVSKEIYL